MSTPVWIYLENGLFLKAKHFGKSGTRVGRLTFASLMSGYEELITNPCTKDEFIVFTMPEVGVVGINALDAQSSNIYANLIIKRLNEKPSNFNSKKSLREFFDSNDGFGIHDIDTRLLTKLSKDKKSFMMVASTKISNKDELKQILNESKNYSKLDLISSLKNEDNLSCEKDGKKIAILDLGVNRSLLKLLCDSGFKATIYPANTKASKINEDIKAKKISGVLISNGPGDPHSYTNIIKNIKELISAKVPILGLNLGEKLISLALGYELKDSSSWNYGGSYPVKNLKSGQVEVAIMKNLYSLSEEILNISEPNYISLKDDSIAGVSFKNYPIITANFMFELNPNSNESKEVLKAFSSLL